MGRARDSRVRVGGEAHVRYATFSCQLVGVSCHARPFFHRRLSVRSAGIEVYRSSMVGPGRAGANRERSEPGASASNKQMPVRRGFFSSASFLVLYAKSKHKKDDPGLEPCSAKCSA